MAKKKKVNSSSNNLVAPTVGVSALLAAMVLYRTFVIVQNLKMPGYGADAPNSFAFWPSLILATYAFVKTKDVRVKYLSIIVLTVLATSILVWLFGATNALNLQTNMP